MNSHKLFIPGIGICGTVVNLTKFHKPSTRIRDLKFKNQIEGARRKILLFIPFLLGVGFFNLVEVLKQEDTIFCHTPLPFRNLFTDFSEEVPKFGKGFVYVIFKSQFEQGHRLSGGLYRDLSFDIHPNGIMQGQAASQQKGELS